MKMSMGQLSRRLLGFVVAGAALVTSGAAFAELGQPAPWEYKLQEAGSPVMAVPSPLLLHCESLRIMFERVDFGLLHDLARAP